MSSTANIGCFKSRNEMLEVRTHEIATGKACRKPNDPWSFGASQPHDAFYQSVYLEVIAALCSDATHYSNRGRHQCVCSLVLHIYA